ncbi:MAG: hypothetical protein WBJ13_00470 [Sedimentibacter sp.]
MKIENMQKIQTGFYNTPIHKLENLSKKYGMNIYIKRDDMTGYALGGNKLRKITKDKNVMLLHTGGVPGLFSEGHSEAMQEELWGIPQKEFKL